MKKQKLKWFLCVFAVAAGALAVALKLFIRIYGQDIEPQDFSDLALPSIADIAPEDNAYTYFQKAYKAANLSDETRNILTAYLYPDQMDNLSPKDKPGPGTNSIAQIISENKETFDYLQQGSQCHSFAASYSNDIVGLCTLSDLLCAKIRLAQESNNLDDAIQDTSTLIRCGKLTLHNASTLVIYLVGATLEQTGMNEIQRLARNDSLSAAQLEKLRDLIGIVPSHIGPALNIIKEHVKHVLEMVDEIAGSKKRDLIGCGIPRFNYTFHPNRTKLALAQPCRAALAQIPQPFSEVNSNDFAASFEFYMYFDKNSVGKIFGYMASPVSWIMMAIERRCLLDANVAATKIIIACHLFQRATGRRPQTLGELVPDYLPAVPLDPFDGKPFRYKPGEGIIYSVGKSLKDLDGAAMSPETAGNKNEFPRSDDNAAVFRIWE